MNAHRRQEQCSIIVAVAKRTAIQIPLYTVIYSIENEVRDEMRLSTFFFGLWKHCYSGLQSTMLFKCSCGKRKPPDMQLEERTVSN